jgi:hypothetical protein
VPAHTQDNLNLALHHITVTLDKVGCGPDSHTAVAALAQDDTTTLGLCCVVGLLRSAGNVQGAQSNMNNLQVSPCLPQLLSVACAVGRLDHCQHNLHHCLQQSCLTTGVRHWVWQASALPLCASCMLVCVVDAAAPGCCLTEGRKLTCQTNTLTQLDQKPTGQKRCSSWGLGIGTHNVVHVCCYCVLHVSVMLAQLWYKCCTV